MALDIPDKFVYNMDNFAGNILDLNDYEIQPSTDILAWVEENEKKRTTKYDIIQVESWFEDIG